MFPRFLLAALFATSAAAEPFSFVALGDTTLRATGRQSTLRPADRRDQRRTAGILDPCRRPPRDTATAAARSQESPAGLFQSFCRPGFLHAGEQRVGRLLEGQSRRGGPDRDTRADAGSVLVEDPRNLGRVRIPLVRESDEIPEFGEFAENARWTFGGGLSRP